MPAFKPESTNISTLRVRAWRKANPEKNKAQWQRRLATKRSEVQATAKRLYQRQRMAKIVELGGKCACCGETELVFLHIDHVDNDGAEDRRQNKTAYKAFYSRRRLQVLCANCNWAKRYGECPHKRRLANAS